MATDRRDLSTPEDIVFMVDTFYGEVREDALLNPVFADIAGVNWEEHLPRMYAFWKKLLLGEGSYAGNPFRKHYPLPIDERHFRRWLALFERNIDRHFAGEMAEAAKLRARSIGHIFQSKLAFLKGE